MEEKLKALEGITFEEWLKLRTTVDYIFSEIQGKSTFKVEETTNDEFLERVRKIATSSLE